MPLIPYADTAALPDKAREAFERLPRKLNIFRMWSNAPEMFVSGMRFGGNILSRQKLGADLRELIILLVARIEGGTYEWVQHVPIAKHAGCKDDQIAAGERRFRKRRVQRKREGGAEIIRRSDPPCARQ